jgi:hypothetical protein
VKTVMTAVADTARNVGQGDEDADYYIFQSMNTLFLILSSWLNCFFLSFFSFFLFFVCVVFVFKLISFIFISSKRQKIWCIKYTVCFIIRFGLEVGGEGDSQGQGNSQKGV